MVSLEPPVFNPEPPISFSHFARTLEAYRGVIVFWMAGVGLLYTIIALALYLTAPAERVLSVPIRLDFEGAREGKYPSGEKFSPNDIIATPLLRRVYQANQLSRYLTFDEFAPRIFVIESNPEFERLAAEYEARLADPKILPADRDRLEKEFQAKRQSLDQNHLTLNIAGPANERRLPEDVLRKVLADIPATWANYAMHEGRVTQYHISVLSPSVLDDRPADGGLIVQLRILTGRLEDILANIADVSALPSAQVARTADGTSLEEVEIKVEDLLRFRVQPLIIAVRQSGLIGNKEAAIRFTEAQLAYDQRQVRIHQLQAEAIQQALALFTMQSTPVPTTQDQEKGMPNLSMRPAPTETLMPQVSDTFLDRLAQLLKQSSDVEYRQKLIDELRKIQANMVPSQAEVEYDTQLLKELQTPSAGGPVMTQQEVVNQIEAVRGEAKRLVKQVGEIYEVTSRNLNPSTQLYFTPAPPTGRTERNVSSNRLLAIGVLLLLIAFPVVVIGCLLHNRIREEEFSERNGEMEPGTAV